MLLLQLRDTPYLAYINGIDISPDGTQLAYTVIYDNAGQQITAEYPSRPTGVWIAPLGEGQPTWLHSNSYPRADGSGADQFRTFSDPEWSPDGQGLIVRGNYWERSTMHWIFPLQFAEDGTYLHTLSIADPAGGNPGADWGHASWTTDSQGLIFSAQWNVTFGNLAYTRRDGTQAETWQAGKLANLYISGAHMLADESYLPSPVTGMAAGPGRMIYIARCPICQGVETVRLHAVLSRLVDPYMNGSVLGTQTICPTSGISGVSNQLMDIEWAPEFNQGAAVCSSGEIHLMDMYDFTLLGLNLLPKLPGLAEGQVPIFRWGEIVP